MNMHMNIDEIIVFKNIANAFLKFTQCECKIDNQDVDKYSRLSKKLKPKLIIAFICFVKSPVKSHAEIVQLEKLP